MSCILVAFESDSPTHTYARTHTSRSLSSRDTRASSQTGWKAAYKRHTTSQYDCEATKREVARCLILIGDCGHHEARDHRLDCDCLLSSSSFVVCQSNIPHCLVHHVVRKIQHPPLSPTRAPPSSPATTPASSVTSSSVLILRRVTSSLILTICPHHRAISAPDANPQATSARCGRRRRSNTICEEEEDKRHRPINKSFAKA